MYNIHIIVAGEKLPPGLFLGFEQRERRRRRPAAVRLKPPVFCCLAKDTRAVGGEYLTPGGFQERPGRKWLADLPEKEFPGLFPDPVI
jgi:hypothetical protein